MCVFIVGLTLKVRELWGRMKTAQMELQHRDRELAKAYLSLAEAQYMDNLVHEALENLRKALELKGLDKGEKQQLVEKLNQLAQQADPKPIDHGSSE